MTSIPKPIDPFARYTKKYSPKNLLWASNRRGCLEQHPPPFQLTQATDGTIRVCKVVTKFQQSTGIQEGFQLLQLQGKDVVAEYPGGFEEICTVVRGSLTIQVVALKPSTASTKEMAMTKEKPSKNRKTVQESLLASLKPSTDSKGMANPKPTNKPKDRPNGRSKRRCTFNHPVKLSSIPQTLHDTTSDDTISKKYKRSDLLWACSTKQSVPQFAPFRLAQYPSGAIRIVQVETPFQAATGIMAGQRVVQLQGKNIEAYRDFDEVQKVVKESLELNLLVLKRKKTETTYRTTESSKSVNSSQSSTARSSSSKPSPAEKSPSMSPSLSKRRSELLKDNTKLIKGISSE